MVTSLISFAVFFGLSSIGSLYAVIGRNCRRRPIKGPLLLALVTTFMTGVTSALAINEGVEQYAADQSRQLEAIEREFTEFEPPQRKAIGERSTKDVMKETIKHMP